MDLELRSPQGSDPEGPSPFCAPLTPSSNSTLAQLRHNRAQFGIILDLLYSILDMLEKVRRVRNRTHGVYLKTDAANEKQVRHCVCVRAVILRCAYYAA